VSFSSGSLRAARLVSVYIWFPRWSLGTRESAELVNRKLPPSIADNGSSPERATRLELATFSFGSCRMTAVTVAVTTLTETPSGACTNACTRKQDSDQETLETLAADLRRRLSVGDCRRLAELLTGEQT